MSAIDTVLDLANSYAPATAYLAERELVGLRERIAALEEALRSIAKASCCAPCSEAGLVARKALEQ